MAHAQLHFINDYDIPEDMWRLDPQTIDVGRRGLAKAREALQTSLRAQLSQEQAEGADEAININRAGHKPGAGHNPQTSRTSLPAGDTDNADTQPNPTQGRLGVAAA